MKHYSKTGNQRIMPTLDTSLISTINFVYSNHVQEIYLSRLVRVHLKVVGLLYLSSICRLQKNLWSVVFEKILKKKKLKNLLSKVVFPVCLISSKNLLLVPNVEVRNSMKKSENNK